MTRLRVFRSAAQALALIVIAGCGGGSGDPADLRSSHLLLSQGAMTSDEGTIQQIVVKPRATIQDAFNIRLAELAALYSSAAGTALTVAGQTHNQAVVLRLPAPISKNNAERMVGNIGKLDGVEYAEVDLRLQTQAVPNDPLLSRQWSLREETASPGGIDVLDAWDTSIGDPNVVVAVLDTGVLPHADLNGRLVPGYDFVRPVASANDGNGRDADASDPGNWVTAQEAQSVPGAFQRPSSWHGTHVAGIVAANANNGTGIAGVSPGSRIQPVRVIGKYGAEYSDIADAVYWAAGGTLTGIPQNATPARVINLSLGGRGACSSTMQSAINAAIARGASVVVSAGNEIIDVAAYTPANCAGVITVASVNSMGQLASYSNAGSRITISAPGGDVNGGGGIYSLSDDGDRSPRNSGTYAYQAGTSQAAPHVSGVIALMLSVRPTLTPDDIKFLLQSTARKFPTGTGRDCNTNFCGAGIVNASAAVRAAANAASGVTTISPQSGIWWNPSESGRGFVIDIANGSLSFGGYLYDASGRATWYTSAGPMTSRTSYSGPVLTYAGGQTLTGGYKAAVAGASAGQISIDFSSPTRATIIWAGTRIPIDRVRFNPGTALSRTFSPEAGIWWNPSEPGRGFALEVQDGTLMMAAFMYDAAGSPTWYLAAGPMSGQSFSGRFVKYMDGQALGGAYRAPVVSNDRVSEFNLQFQDTGSAVLRLASGQSIPLQKFRTTPNAPSVFIPPNFLQTSRLLGLWKAQYRFGFDYTDYFVFYSVYESPITAGDYITRGINHKDDLAVAGWFSAQRTYVMVAEGFGYYDMYTFGLSNSGDSMENGCYFFVLTFPSTHTSDCYPLTGNKLFAIAPLSLDASAYPDPVSKADRDRAKLEHGALALNREDLAIVQKGSVLARRPEVDDRIRMFETMRALAR